MAEQAAGGNHDNMVHEKNAGEENADGDKTERNAGEKDANGDETNKGASKNDSNEDKTKKRTSTGALTTQGKNKTPSLSSTGGVKVKMPSKLLELASKAEAQIVQLQNAGSVEAVVAQAVDKFDAALTRVIREAEAVKTADASQEAAKAQWIKKNIASKQTYLKELKEALGMTGINPTILLNDDALDIVESKASRSSIGGASSLASERAREAAAEEALLANEHKRLLRRREQQEEERRLRLKRLEMQDQERRLQEQREQDDLEARLEQARLRRELLEEEGSIRALSRKSRKSRCSQAKEVLARLPRPQLSTSEWVEDSARYQPHAVNDDQIDDVNYLAPHQPGDLPVRPEAVNSSLLQQALLPTITLPIFHGDCIEFLWFMKAFELQVEMVTSDAGRRLHLLLQHLKGEAYDLVRGCQLASSPAIGFSRAKAKLLEEYGNPVRQTLAFKQKLLNWPQVRKEGKELRAFYTQLQLCAEVKANGRLAELDASSTLLQLMNKLPGKMQEGWQRRACRVEAQEARDSNFSDFVKFIKEQSDAVNHPVFGKPLPQPLEDPNQRKVKTFATTITGPNEIDAPDQTSDLQLQTATTLLAQGLPIKDAFNPPCLLCQGAHATEHCGDAHNKTMEEKKEALRGLCFSCLRNGHLAKYCRARLSCRVCNKRHPTILHDKAREKGKEIEEEETTKTETEVKRKSSFLIAGAGKVALSVVPVKVWLKKEAKSILVRAILDNASTATFISEALVTKLGLPSKPSDLRLTTMTAVAPLSLQMVQGLHVSDLDHNHPIELPSAFVMPSIPVDPKDLPTREEIIKWPHLAAVPFNWDHQDSPIEMLIGADAPLATTPLKIVPGRDNQPEPYAQKTRLGWAVNGPVAPTKNCSSACLLSKGDKTVNNEDVKRQLEHLYYQDFDQVFNFTSKGPSQDDNRWFHIVRSTIKRDEEGKYQIALPFRSLSIERHSDLVITNNFQQALSRLNSLRRKFEQNSKFHEDYVAFVQKMEKGNCVEEVDMTLEELQREALQPAVGVSYIPHHGVYHPRKPGKIRVVFNCSSKFRGVSLNDCLLQGPDLTSSLIGVLLRFRVHAVPFIADIESMFYQVHVPPEQRDNLRYLWWPGGKVSEGNVKAYRLKVHLFGAASSPSCANFALRYGAQQAFNEGKVTREVKDAVETNFYVDDCLKSMPDEESAVRMAKGLITACAHGGFKLGKFISTHNAVLKELKKDQLASPPQAIDLHDSRNQLVPVERALGVAWQLDKDAFCFKIAQQKKPIKITKRNILSKLSAVYDPLGFAAPVVIVARVLFRTCVKNVDDWDADLSILNHEEVEKWIKWTEALSALQTTSIPRCFQPQQNKSGQWQLHLFCDASLDAYAAVAYLRLHDENEGSDNKHVTFVFGKARVSPPKVVTVPRLELAAAKLATDIANMLQRELQTCMNVSQRYFWSDSQTVLKYINNTTKRFHTYVANRVASILASTTPAEWRYVPTHDNPADEATRGLTAEKLQDSKWLNGPVFLYQRQEFWPTAPANDSQDDETDPEVKAITLLTTNHAPESTTPFVEIWAQRYSTAFKMRRAGAIWMRFKAYLAKWPVHKGPISLEELRQSESALIKWLQKETWPKELALVQDGHTLPKRSELHKLSPKLEDDLLLMSSRTRQSLPIIPEGTLAQLLIMEAHENQLHSGRQATMAAVLKTHWIIKLGKQTRTLLRNCPSCQRRNARPKQSAMASLPDFRLEPETFVAFETTGIDYFGPFSVKMTPNGDPNKVYGVIFTCATSRAVHLELAADLSSGGFLNVLRRFVARRGHCKRIISDNATNFDGAHAEMQRAIREELASQSHEDITTQLRNINVEWRFNAPTASHHGGFFERLIRSIRKAISVAIGAKKNLTYDAFLTLLCEVESVLNNRPLTHASEDPNDFEVITPNHLLLGQAGPSAPPGNRSLPTNASLRTHYRKVQHVANRFWQRWMDQYRILLHQRAKWHCKPVRPLQVHDVVLVTDALHPREHWKLGRIVSICKNPNAQDDEVRVVEVRTRLGYITRPVSKLCLLEAASQ